MKYSRETKVGILAIICLFLLIFGFNFLKGVNIFSSVMGYRGKFVVVNGLTEQAPVYIRGLKVGQVDKIHYDFSQDTAFIVDVSIARDIHLPQGTQMALVADGLLGGTAIELQIPSQQQGGAETFYSRGEFIPTLVVPGLVDVIQQQVLTELTATVAQAKELLAVVNRQLEDDHLYRSLSHIDSLTASLSYSSTQLKKLMQHQVPSIVNEADSTLANLQTLSADLRQADLKKTIAKVDTVADQVSDVLASIKDDQGTIGKLIQDPSLYNNINSTVVSADSLLIDLKAHPKRYVHFSLFGKKGN